MSTPDAPVSVPGSRDVSAAGQGIAMAAVALNTAMSQAMGLHPSEGLCLWHVTESAYGEPLTAGKLAEATGLTTGAITGIIDRLEAAGLVRRERDTADRRKVFIRPVPARMAIITELFAPMEGEFDELVRQYRPEQVTVIFDYLSRSVGILHAQIERLRAVRVGSAGRQG
ncbi:MAG TPA: MarR family transcriptional regulator [Streptosporangiaceae bacterium]|nr:MarR family transcriptional regulator [Streptosporangiaceae bacterium]